MNRILRNIVSVLLVVFSCSVWLSVAAAQDGALFIYATEESVNLRWNAPLQAGYRGFHVERKSSAETAWQRLTREPVVRIQDVNEIRALLGFNAEGFLTFFDPDAKSISDADFKLVASDEIARSFIQLFSVKDPAIGRVLGEIYVDETLRPGQSFDYRVIRIDNTGAESVWAQSTRPITHGSADIIPVTQGINGVGGHSIAMLGWQHQPALSRSGEVVSYYVYRSEKPFGPFQKVTADAIIPTAIDGSLPEFFLTDRYLDNGTHYFYYVAGMNVLGFESDPSETIEIIPGDLEPPPPPETLTARLLSTHALLEWSAVEADDLAGYRIYRAQALEGPYELAAPPEGSTPQQLNTYLDRAIMEGDIFWYQVTAVDESENESIPSLVAEIFRPDITPPASPADVVAEARDDGIYIRWAANEETDLAGYLVKRTTRIQGKGPDAKVTDQFFTQNVVPLRVLEYKDPVPERSEARYAYHIIAVDNAQNLSEPSATVFARMPDIVPPSRPAVHRLIREGEEVAIYWGTSSEPDLAGYRIYRSPEGSDSFSLLTKEILGPEITRYSHTPTETGSIFQYQMTAVDESGNESEPSFALPIKYLDVVGPEAPTGLEIEILDEGLQVSWTPSSSSDVSYVYIYRVMVKGQRPRPLRELTPTATQTLDVFVEEDQSYSYFLRAYDQMGNMGQPSEMVTATFTRDSSEQEGRQ